MGQKKKNGKAGMMSLTRPSCEGTGGGISSFIGPTTRSSGEANGAEKGAIWSGGVASRAPQSSTRGTAGPTEEGRAGTKGPIGAETKFRRSCSEPNAAALGPFTLCVSCITQPGDFLSPFRIAKHNVGNALGDQVAGACNVNGYVVDISTRTLAANRE